MKISIVMPCFNAKAYVRQTIKSIIDQDFEDYELIAIDGGSTDGTLDVINEYSCYFSKVVSEPDNGQYDAIMKGFSLATGDVFCWLNADDVYFPWTLKTVADIFEKYEGVNWISGMPAFLDGEGQLTNIYNTVSAKPSKFIKEGWFRCDFFGFLQQESMFWRKSVWNESGGLNLNYKLAGDFELWTKFAIKEQLVSVGLPLAGFRQHDLSRSKLQFVKYMEEVSDVCKLKKKKNCIIQRLLKNNLLNRLFRISFWVKSPIMYYSVRKKAWILNKKRRPISSISLTHLFLEI